MIFELFPEIHGPMVEKLIFYMGFSMTFLDFGEHDRRKKHVAADTFHDDFFWDSSSYAPGVEGRGVGPGTLGYRSL